MIRKVEIRANDGKWPDITGHWVEAETEEDILWIVKRHNIAKPIGRDLTNAEVIVCDNDFLEDYAPKRSIIFDRQKGTIELNRVQKDRDGVLRFKSFSRGKVWFEENGELRSIPIRERYRQLTKVAANDKKG